MSLYLLGLKVCRLLEVIPDLFEVIMGWRIRKRGGLVVGSIAPTYECISKHIAAKIQENILGVNCPSMNCRGVLLPELCQEIIPKQVFERWQDTLCESLILASKRLYCPYNDCSAVFIDDGDEIVTQSECPNCRRMFCARCLVTWHSGMECGEFQRLGKDERGKDDLMAMELAKNKKWRKCPNCRFYVEKREGCSHITCRCRYEFCYGCGAKWISYSHQCPQS